MNTPDASLGSQPTASPGDALPDGIHSVGDVLTARQRKRFKAGDVLCGRYKILGELGQGGMGLVFRCLDEVGGIEVAVKMLPPEVSHDTGEMEEVRENFQLVTKLSHPNIATVRTLERDAQSGEYLLVLEVAEGVNLRQWRKKGEGGRRSLAEILPVVRQVAAALDYAHARKVIHRDIKPANIMVGPDGTVKVLDFGLAAQIYTSYSRVSQSRFGTSGTGPYMAPEQWRGEYQDGKTDQYALGVLAYELIAGRCPFENSDTIALREAVLRSSPLRPSDVTTSLWSALITALAKQRNNRFDSCLEFARQLAGARAPKRAATILLSSLCLLIFVGFAVTLLRRSWQVTAAWEAAQSEGTETSYRTFAEKNGSSSFAVQALQRAGELKAERERQEAEERARQKMESAWSYAQAVGTEAAYTEFAATHGSSPYAEQALRRADELKAERERREAEERARQKMERAWGAAAGEGTEAAYAEFAANYGSSPYAEQALQRISALKVERERREAEGRARQKMESAWSYAQAVGTEAAYKEFAATYVSSPYAEQASWKSRELRAEQERREAQALEAQTHRMVSEGSAKEAGSVDQRRTMIWSGGMFGDGFTKSATHNGKKISFRYIGGLQYPDGRVDVEARFRLGRVNMFGGGEYGEMDVPIGQTTGSGTINFEGTDYIIEWNRDPGGKFSAPHFSVYAVE